MGGPSHRDIQLQQQQPWNGEAYYPVFPGKTFKSTWK